jgi:hypothetical protein
MVMATVGSAGILWARPLAQTGTSPKKTTVTTVNRPNSPLAGVAAAACVSLSKKYVDGRSETPRPCPAAAAR